MKKLSLVIMVLFLAVGTILAQRTVTGKITDDAGDALIGANILVKGTQVGTVTDLDGNYTVEVPEGSNTIVISYTGYETREMELGASNVLDVTMSEGVLLTEAVVTALGITREKKTLGYATQEVEGEELTRVKDANFINSLSGKVAGLDVKRNTNLGGSSNVIIRGYTSLTGNNQALFVVNGTPINNDITNTRDMQTGRGGYDYGNAAMDINPEDVESINVLRGAAATALYGSRAANGVIIITTKQGAKKKGLGVTFSTGYTAGKVDDTTMPRYQKEYGPGYGEFYPENGYFYLFDFDGDGVEETLTAPTYEDASYGAKLDPNLMVADWRSFYRELGTYGQTFPFVAGANDGTTFYETSNTFNNSIAIDGGGEKSNFRLSYTNFDQSGVVPNSKLKRNTFTFGGGYDLSDKWKAQANASFTNTKGKGRYGTGYDGANVNQSFRQWYQVTTDIQAQKDAYEQTGLNLTWNPRGPNDPANAGLTSFFDNYYWTVNENFQTDERNRLMGNISLTYKITDWLDIMGRAAIDTYSELQEERIAIGSNAVSKYLRFNRDFSETNYDVILNANRYFGEGDVFNFSGNLGMNIRRNTLTTVKNETNGGLITPGLYALSNSVGPIVNPMDKSGNLLIWEQDEEIGVNGYFLRAGLGYDNFLYLDLTGRYDVSSTLPKGDNGYFYPSASLSFVFSEFLGSNVFSFGKLRLNYAEVGNDAPFGAINNTYDLAPAFGGTALASASNTQRDPNLKPESTKSYEIGVEANFWQNRLGIDLTWYQANTFDQIIPVTTSPTIGSLFKFVNAGEIQNTGIELTLTGTPVRTSDFSWDIAVNWATNDNEVISLFEDQTNLQLSTAQGGISTNATVGEPYGNIWGSDYVYHTNGEPIVYPMVHPIYGPQGVRFARNLTPQTIGNIQADWKGGVMNTLSYKSLSFSFLIDIQQGGDFFSLDQWYGTATGIYEHTAGLNDKGIPVRDLVTDGGGIPVGGVLQTGTDPETGLAISDGTVNTEYGWAGDVYNVMGYARGVNKMHIYDASYVKLREIALTYSLPSSLFENVGIIGIDVSLIGRNLWIISKDTEYSDPEAGLSAGNIQGNQSGVYPAVKEYGINLNFRF